MAERIDAHRKARAAAHGDVTLTGLYNVLEKLRNGEELTAKERALHDHGLVAVLKALHDDLDAAVLTSYGWADLNLPQDCDVLLERLVALNTRRAAEANAGTIRWIRPALQKPASGEQAGMEMPGETDTKAATAPFALVKLPWPTTLPEQIKAIAQLLAVQPTPVGIDAIAAHFTSRGRWRERLPTIVETLQALGRARARPGHWLGSGFE